MKIISYNVNGIRAASTKGLFNWLKATDADMVCLQEVKALKEQIPEIIGLIEQLGYHHYWFPAEKKGYSGVAILTKIKPNNISYGCGEPWIDAEGRILRADFDTFSLMSLYMPSGSSGDERQVKKYEFMRFFDLYINDLRKQFPNLIISGDYNICHQPIDIHNPKSNANSSGFLPEERAWMDNWFELGMIDTFRHIYPEEKAQYSWWSQRFNARANNKGWRIDYFSITENLLPELKSAAIHPEVKHSDHCPISIQIF